MAESSFACVWSSSEGCKLPEALSPHLRRRRPPGPDADRDHSPGTRPPPHHHTHRLSPTPACLATRGSYRLQILCCSLLVPIFWPFCPSFSHYFCFQVRMRREAVELSSVYSKMLVAEEGAPSVGYISLANFSQHVARDVASAIKDLEQQGASRWGR